MRMMLHVRIPDTEAGNRGIRDGAIGKVINTFVEQH
jgi:hypothetical protein